MSERQRFEREIAQLEGREHEGGATSGSPSPGLPPQCAQPSPWPDVSCDRSRPSAELQRRRIVRLREVISEGILTTKPHAKASVGGGVFAGSWDWHSAVHAHWALLAIARVTGDANLEAQLGARLDDKAIQAERKFLNDHGAFELPYGRAWLLLLLSELDRRPSRSKAVVALREEMQELVLHWLERAAYPEGGNRAAPSFDASHGSWLFAYLLAVLSQPKSTAALNRLRDLHRDKVEPQRAALAKVPVDPRDFLYLPAVQALIDRVDPAASGKPSAYPAGISPALVDPPLDETNAHSAGAALVLIWPHAIDSHSGDRNACARFHARIGEFFSRKDHWADSFQQVAHWVPQFMWMALWLEAGRP
jgi:hypothetical protein